MKHHILDKTFWVYTAIAVACWCVGTGLMFLLYNCLHVGYWIASACPKTCSPRMVKSALETTK